MLANLFQMASVRSFDRGMFASDQDYDEGGVLASREEHLVARL